MTATQKIPIQNIYYLLCYAWNKLEERDVVNVDVIDTTSLLDLFAKVLVNGLNHLIKRGLDRGYVTWADESRCLRGKICFAPTLKRNLLVKANIHCEHDELSHNVLHNQILKSTIHSLIPIDDIAEELRDELVGSYRKLHGIDSIELNRNVFSRVQLNRNNAFYDFILRICELIYDSLLISEDPGKRKFRDFLQDEKRMAHLFEEFIRNFYKLEAKAQRVGREEIPWQAEVLTEDAASLLPKMITDVSIERNGSKVVIEVKYYKEALAIHFDQEKLHSPHMYQLYAYLKNLEAKGGINKRCTGILLYPTVQKDICQDLVMDGHKVMVRTVDLNQHWKSIHKHLIDILDHSCPRTVLKKID